MRNQIRSAALALAFALGCGGTGTPTGPAIHDFGTLNAAKVELVEEGGLAAFSTTRRASHDDRSFLFVRRQLCGVTCPAAPLDSASGSMAPAASDSLFSLIWSASPMSLKSDYGTTRNAADMVTYTLRVTFDGATKTVRADDGTMPPAMRRIVDVVRGIVDASRQ